MLTIRENEFNFTDSKTPPIVRDATNLHTTEKEKNSPIKLGHSFSYPIDYKRHLTFTDRKM